MIDKMAQDKRKQSLYFPKDMLADLQRECDRLDRSLSWVAQKCVKLALNELRGLPGEDGKPSPLFKKAD